MTGGDRDDGEMPDHVLNQVQDDVVRHDGRIPG